MRDVRTSDKLMPFGQGTPRRADSAGRAAMACLLVVAGVLFAVAAAKADSAPMGGVTNLVDPAPAIMQTARKIVSQDRDKAFFNRREVWWILSGILLVLMAGLAVWRIVSVIRLNRELVEAAEARNRAESAQRASDQRLEFAFETGNVGMNVADPDGRLQRVNRAYCEFLGYDEIEILGRLTVDFMHPEEAADSQRSRGRMLAGETDKIQCERRFVRKDGAVVWGLCGFSAVRDENGDIIYTLGNIQDITERKEAGQALAETNQRVRGIMDNIADGIVTIDEDGIIESVNPAVTDMFGYRPDELVGNLVNMLMPESFARRHKGFLGAYLKTGVGKILGFGSREVPGLRKDGSVFSMSLAVSEMRLGESRVFIGALRDITEQKSSEAELVRKTGFLDLVRTTAVAANEASSFDEAVRACLDDVCVSLGWQVGQAFLVVGEGSDATLSPVGWYAGDPVRFEPFRQRTVKSRIGWGHGLPGRVLETGKPEWVTVGQPGLRSPRLRFAEGIGVKSGFAVPVLSGSEIVAVIEFFSEEISEPDDALLEVMMQVGTQLGRVFERERAADATRANEERLRTIIDLVPHRIFIKDREGKYLLANKAAADSHGLKPEDLIGKSHVELHPGDLQGGNFTPDDVEVIDSGRPKLIPEEVFVDSNGRTVTLRTIKVPYTVVATGETAVLGVSVDITELKAAENQLRHAQKLEAIGHLTGGLAHDFNNLLTIVLGNLQLLVRDLDDDRLKQMVITAERAGRRGAELTHRLLAFGRRQPLEPKATDFNRLVAGMSDLLRRTLGEAVEIETIAADDLTPTLVDPSQVENALLNLSINARDAMPQGGKLTIRTSNQHIGRQRAARHEGVKPGDYVMLAVSDTGTGMPPDVAERAFDPFFTTKEVGKGSGLGLSMIYGFCWQSGGFATIDSKPGEGTTVSLYLPTTDEVVEPEIEDVTDVLDEKGFETILVVEDDPGVRMFAATVLNGLNYNVLEAEDWPTALEQLESNGRVDVLFTDIVLPGGVDGRDIAERARKQQPDIGILFTSGFAMEENDDAVRNIDNIALLKKPYTGADLVTKIRTVMENMDGNNP